MTGRGSEPEALAGVRALDHTADVGIEVRAGSLDRLFDRAARGMLALIRGDEDGAEPAGCPGSEARATPAESVAPGPAPRDLVLDADDAAGLLAVWLRELLYLHEVHGFDYRSAAFETLDERRLRARVRAEPEPPTPVRELKGVTYHGLEAVRTADGTWRARVIFDV